MGKGDLNYVIDPWHVVQYLKKFSRCSTSRYTYGKSNLLINQTFLILPLHSRKMETYRYLPIAKIPRICELWEQSLNPRCKQSYYRSIRHIKGSKEPSLRNLTTKLEYFSLFKTIINNIYRIHKIIVSKLNFKFSKLIDNTMTKILKIG